MDITFNIHDVCFPKRKILHSRGVFSEKISKTFTNSFLKHSLIYNIDPNSKCLIPEVCSCLLWIVFPDLFQCFFKDLFFLGYCTKGVSSLSRILQGQVSTSVYIHLFTSIHSTLKSIQIKPDWRIERLTNSLHSPLVLDGNINGTK